MYYLSQKGQLAQWLPARHARQLAGVAGGERFIHFEMFYTYVLQSTRDEKLYVGFTENLQKRYIEHQKGLVNTTKYRRPLTLIYYESCLIKEKAIAREQYFKTGFGRKFLKERLSLQRLPEIPGN